MDKDALRTLVDKGLSQREIAAECKCSQGTVKYWLARYGLQTRKKKTPSCPCGETDPSQFYGNKTSICGRCHNQYTIEQGRQKRAKAIEYLGGRCIKCGYDRCIAALDIHHTDPLIKDSHFKSMRGWGWKRILAEIQSCILLCRNCHAEEHYE